MLLLLAGARNAVPAAKRKSREHCFRPGFLNKARKTHLASPKILACIWRGLQQDLRDVCMRCGVGVLVVRTRARLPLLLLRGCRGVCHALADAGRALEEGWQ